MHRYLSIFVFVIILLTSFTVPTNQVRASTCPLAYCFETQEQISASTNQFVELQVGLSASRAVSDAIVDFEIFDARGTRVYQKYLEHQYISINSTKNYQLSWKPTSTGIYTVRAGIFNAQWSGVLSWNDKVSEIKVTSPTLVSVQTSTVSPSASVSLNIWWPHNGITLTGTQHFKFAVLGMDLNAYDGFWQVDKGQLNLMQNSSVDGAHKEALIHVGGWNWKGAGPYVLTFSAKDKNGKILAQKDVTIYIGSVPSGVVYTNPVEEIIPTQSTLTISGLYVNPNSPALAQAQTWEISNPTNATLMKKIGEQPSARWFGGWNTNVYQDVKNYVDAAASANAMPVLVAYNIPQRDCGGYSGGGSNSPEGYKTWISDMAQGIGTRKALIILEPDALALNNCLSQSDKQTRFDLLKFAITTFNTNPNALVYLDAGHANWIGVSDMASRLTQAGITQADGFSLNVSNFISTSDSTKYGTEISKLINNKHFVIDTSRNGLGSNGEWCNPLGRALGNKPTLSTGNALIDAYLWIKTPGESDGNCNGGPSAGQWWSAYALGLAQKATW